MMTQPFRIALFLVAAAALPLSARAQAPAAPATQPPAKTDAPNPDLPVPPAGFEYAAEGRRDPFVSLIDRGTEAGGTSAPAVRAEGVPGLMTSEIVVKGIVLTRGAYVAMVTSVDNKVYSIRAGDKLADGVVRAVTAQAVVIQQEVNDPLSLQKTREVRKLLRGGEEVK